MTTTLGTNNPDNRWLQLYANDLEPVLAAQGHRARSSPRATRRRARDSTSSRSPRAPARRADRPSAGRLGGLPRHGCRVTPVLDPSEQFVRALAALRDPANQSTFSEPGFPSTEWVLDDGDAAVRALVHTGATEERALDLLAAALAEVGGPCWQRTSSCVGRWASSTRTAELRPARARPLRPPVRTATAEVPRAVTAPC
jgi:hypothetical protein